MAKSISDEELQLKKRARRRLIGAIALVILVVVFLPMVLDDEPKPLEQDIAINIPAPDSDGFVAKMPPPRKIAAPAASAPLAASAAPAEDQPAPAALAAAPPPPQADPRPAPAAAQPEAKAAKGGTAAKESYVVQVGTYANPANATQAHKKINDAGIKTYTEVIKTPQGEKTRVRAGPFATREAAAQANAKLKAIGLDGPIVAKPVK